MACYGQNGLRRVLTGAAIGLVLAVTGTAGLAQAHTGTAPASAAAKARAVCPPTPLWANTGGNDQRLIQYDTTGTALSNVPLARDYGDIAFSPNGSTLYGVDFPGAPDSATLYTIDPVTGAETAGRPISGPLAAVTSVPAVNGLTARADGMLIAGSFNSSQIFLIDPATGVSTLFPASFPAGTVSAGDFITLDDGDVLAFGSTVVGGPSPVFRIRPDNTVVQIGTVPQTFGAAKSAGSVYAFASNGDINLLTSLPTTASTSPLPVTTVEATGRGFYGATSAQDSGSCVVPAYTVAKSASPTGPVNQGNTITYRLTVTNTGTTAANGDFTDDLSDVLDDATFVPGSLTSTSGSANLTGNTLTWTGTLAPGGTATVTYQVRVNTPDTGDHTLVNYVAPTAPGGSCSSARSCSVTIHVKKKHDHEDCDEPGHGHKPGHGGKPGHGHGHGHDDVREGDEDKAA
ncbi:DUF11 domain-containing protein [Streptomyces sp. MMS21 TC-5]|uniref:DUF11 domain-containing protein n=1 Tax=Streptomyces sp. MMS21 TC-5 TaxID=2925833 RepID=UPI001F610EAD|nr:DUF11 domain-containing protein [Streptomyces sp. MMS21 TC-5]MCI4082292.1 DUF11 domain-containing protein [Streptomyces sp. MMS21 TC-5]